MKEGRVMPRRVLFLRPKSSYIAFTSEVFVNDYDNEHEFSVEQKRVFLVSLLVGQLAAFLASPYWVGFVDVIYLLTIYGQ